MTLPLDLPLKSLFRGTLRRDVMALVLWVAAVCAPCVVAIGASKLHYGEFVSHCMGVEN